MFKYLATSENKMLERKYGMAITASSSNEKLLKRSRIIEDTQVPIVLLNHCFASMLMKPLVSKMKLAET